MCELAAAAPKWLTSRSVSVHEGSNSLPRSGATYRISPLRYGFRRRVWLVYGNFSPLCRFLRSFIKAALIAIRVSQVANRELSSKSLTWTEGISEDNRCSASSASSRFRMIRRVTQETCFHMTFAKLSEGGSSSRLGGCYQLLLAPRSKIANR